MLGFRILGPLEIVADGEHVVLPRPKQQELLALLLMRRGETVSTDWLLENLWAGAPPAEARASLQNYVSQLRKALGPDVLVTRAPGYVLAVKPEQTDVGRFERLVEEGCAAERPAERAAKLREGLALWRGSALTEAPQSAFAEVEAARLEELRVEAFEDAIDAELALGAGAGLVSELEQMVAQEPFRERLRAQLMLALYRSGRQAAALEAFQRARATLAEELGLEPSPALRGLERAILNQDAALDLPRTPALLPGERRQLATVLFADLVESAVLADELDPERFRQLLDRVLSLAGAALERHGGTIDRSFGDLAMAVFGVPHAHEDDALRALRAAVDMRSELTTLNKELARENIAPLELRIGVSSGEVFVADPAGGRTLVTGSVVNNAKRLEESACPGEIVLGAGTLRLVRDAARAEGVKAPQLKQERPVAAFRLLELREDAPAIARYFDAALIGRGAELAAIRGAYEEACETGRCRLLTVVGEPGIGKTRLAREFVSTISGSATVLIGRCVAYGDGATVLPLREMVDQVSDLEKQLAGGAESEVLASRVAELVGLSPGTSTIEEGFWAIRRLLEALARKRPLVLLFEDVHWAEPTLLDFIAQLDGITGSTLCLCLARPDLLELRPSWESESLALTSLPEPAVEALVVSFPGGEALSTELRARIVEVAGGNPLFAEQLLAHVREQGPEGMASVPPSVEALIARPARPPRGR
jgi:DNA-binding SARP family transcriptional activator